jgi:hypothetical protein
MFHFQNPSHRQELTRLGILPPDEAQISAEDLAARALESGQLEAVLYVLKQEFAHPLQHYQMIGDTLSILEMEVGAIGTRAEYEQALIQWDKLRAFPMQTAQLIVDIVELLRILQSFLEETDTSSEVQKYLHDIREYVQRLRLAIKTNDEKIQGRLDEIWPLLQQKKSPLD